jgi:NAD(P)H-dependent FMN reductase
MAETVARELGRLDLSDALELTALIAQKDTTRHSRAAARWLRRWLEQNVDATIHDAALVAASLLALGGRHHGEALATLRAAAEASPTVR